MIKVPLRSLHRRIEKAIIDHELGSALTQSISVLKYFPKNLDTYRLIGKLMLESRDYINAEKIFNVVLKVDPDDFVANLGMSLVSESRGNLDQAIHYMERSFELQPGNEAIQNEIKRLALSRDGIELSKVKLTRGALIHLYIQSDLIEQAIAEIRVGLHESPSRMDYRIALAKMLFRSGNHVDAVKTCIEIISQLPYCLEANKLLDQILVSENRSKNATIYRYRLIEMDPYYAFMAPDTPTVQDVPDIAVLINDEEDDSTAIPSLDWDWMIKTIWEEEGEWQHESVHEDINWDTVIQQAIESNTNILGINPVADISNLGIQNDSEEDESVLIQGESWPHSKKDRFIHKLRRTTSDNDSDSSIPGWIFEEDENHPGDQDTLEGDVIVDANTHGQDTITNEYGMVDQDAPVEIQSDDIHHLNTHEWVLDDELTGSEEPLDTHEILDDTKQILVGKVENSELLVLCQKAIDGGNLRFAIDNIQILLEQADQHEEITHLLEDACQNHPHEIALWLKLGETYLLMDQREKALDIFKIAESKISL